MYCRGRSSYQEMRVGTPLTGLTPPHLRACPMRGSGFPTSYGVFFSCVQWVQFRWEVVVRVAVIGGIDYHQCLNSPFIHSRTLWWSKFVKKCLICSFVRHFVFIITSKNTTTETYNKHRHYYNIICGRKLFDYK